jgi:hypothetical protein
MAGNQLITDLAAEARKLGWERDLSVDHIDLVNRAAYQMGLIALALKNAAGPRYLAHVYATEAARQRPAGYAWWNVLIPPSILRDVAYGSPARWVAEIAVAAEGRRRTGGAVVVLGSCWRIQRAILRHGEVPLGRATTRVSDGVRVRQFHILSRATELEEEEEWIRFWSGGSGSSAPGRGTTREGERDLSREEMWRDVDVDESPFDG